jgi:hypothetical protein
MARKNKNARFRPKHKEFKESEAVLIRIDQRRDGISPGRLVAAAEWKSLKEREV